MTARPNNWPKPSPGPMAQFRTSTDAGSRSRQHPTRWVCDHEDCGRINDLRPRGGLLPVTCGHEPSWVRLDRLAERDVDTFRRQERQERIAIQFPEPPEPKPCHCGRLIAVRPGETRLAYARRKCCSSNCAKLIAVRVRWHGR